MLFGFLLAIFGIDDLIVGAAIMAAASAGTAVYTNRQNRKQQQSTNDTSIELANTAHQREVEDLKAAGLNPILSANGAGSSVPSLGVAEQKDFGSGIAESMNSAIQASALDRPKAESQIDVNNATAKNLEAQNANLRMQNKEISARIDKTIAETEKTRAETKFPGHLGSNLRAVGSLREGVKKSAKDWFLGKDSSTSTSANSLNVNNSNNGGAINNSASSVDRNNKKFEKSWKDMTYQERKEQIWNDYKYIKKYIPWQF